MEFRLLGPFVVEVAGRAVPVGRRRDRCLLAVLLLDAGRVVSVPRLIDLLWDGEPAEHARRAVHAHVARVRAALRGAAPAMRIETNGDGYVVHVPPGATDVEEFARLVAAARRSPIAGERAALHREALDLWRGPLLADVATDALRDRIGGRLAELRLLALDGWLTAELDLGRHHDLLPDLARTVDENPGDERLFGLYMLALHRCGRTRAATTAFTEFRRRLVEESGLEPGGELRDLHTAVLRADPALRAPAESGPAAVRPGPPGPHRPAPSGLPPAVTDLVGRGAEAAVLDEALALRGSAPGIVAVHGIGGVGKTALVVAWARRNASRFPDGTTYLDLRGSGHRRPIAPEEALRYLLSALGDSDARIPEAYDRRRLRYRQAMTGLRLLVLDNVPDASTVEDLLPADPEVVVVAVSRDALRGLTVRHHALRLPVRPLPAADAVDLLARAGRLDVAAVGAQRLADLADLCGRLPLALRIVGCRISEDAGHSVESLIADLRPDGRRLAALEIDDGDSGVRAAFEASYRRFAAGTARLFRLAGEHAGPLLAVDAAACLAGIPVAEAMRIMDELAAANLVVRDGAGRYETHDLVRLFARERLAAQESRPARDAAARRLADWYLDTAHHAYPLLSPRRAGAAAPDLVHPPAEPLRYASRDEALAWFESERANLPAVVKDLAARGWHRAAAQLAGSLFAFYHQRRLWLEWIDVYEVGLAAARQAGDWFAQTRVLTGLGVAHKQLGQFARAVAYYEEALALATAAGDPLSIGAIRSNLGGAYTSWGRPAQARAHLDAALGLAGYGDDPRYAPILWLNLGHLHFDQGDLPEAARCFGRGLETVRASGDTHTAAYLHHWLGELALQRGADEEAARHARVELETARAVGDPLREAYALDLLASATAPRDQPGASALWRAAQGIGERLDHPLGADIEAFVRDASGLPAGELAAAVTGRRRRVNRLP